jgi:hypothetical protein
VKRREENRSEEKREEKRSEEKGMQDVTAIAFSY